MLLSDWPAVEVFRIREEVDESVPCKDYAVLWNARGADRHGRHGDVDENTLLNVDDHIDGKDEMSFNDEIERASVENYNTSDDPVNPILEQDAGDGCRREKDDA